MSGLCHWSKYDLDKRVFSEWIASNLQEFRHSLYAIKFSDKEGLIRLKSAIDYVLSNEGKRFRPLLCIAAGELGGTPNNVNKLAAIAIELIHLFSLCQDDLPFMDNDEYRHGKLSVHKKYDVSTALLVCDALIAEAFSILATLPLSDARKILMIQVLTHTIGINGMTGGQFLDLENDAAHASVQLIEDISYLKTTSLIQASVKMGILCRTDIRDAELDKYISVLERYGYLVGQAYQIIDDVMDCCNDEKLLGKTPGKDLRDNKATSVSAIGIKNSVDKALALIEESIAEINALDKKPFSLIGISLTMVDKLILLGEYHE